MNLEAYENISDEELGAKIRKSEKVINDIWKMSKLIQQFGKRKGKRIAMSGKT